MNVSTFVRIFALEFDVITFGDVKRNGDVDGLLLMCVLMFVVGFDGVVDVVDRYKLLMNVCEVFCFGC